MAPELGVSESQAATEPPALLPAILGGFKRQTQAQPTGLEGLAGMLGGLGGGGLLETCEVRSRQVSAATMFSDRSSIEGRESHRRPERLDAERSTRCC